MKRYTYALAGDECAVNYPETADDVREFVEWFKAHAGRVIGLDTETTDLAIYAAGFRCRLVQFGDERTAYVLRYDEFREAIRWAFGLPGVKFTAHNIPFDAQVLDVVGLNALDDTLSRTFDTRIMAHLIDPRMRAEGGMGLKLKELSELYVDATAPDTQEDLTEVFNREYKTTKALGWAVIDIDHPTYVLYAGLDVLLVSRLFRALSALIRERKLSTLCAWEHEVMAVTARMTRRGVRLDVPYTERLVDRLAEDAEDGRKRARFFGVENVNSTAQVATALQGMGWTPTEFTDSGKPKVDKAVLGGLVVLGNELARAVMDAKRAEKWRESYALAMLNGRDASDRVHPSIASLQARTARMSISRPPLQQLPSGDWTIRRALLADEGEVIGGCDYQAVEMRVLAALFNVKAMKRAIDEGRDLHGFTADLIRGPGNWTDKHRKLYKGVGFGKVYGGGADTLSRQTGAPLPDVKNAIAAYDRVYPEIKRGSRALQERAQFGRREVVTPVGRRLPLDGDRLYAATNYLVQSTARDLLAQALVDMDAQGLGRYLLLPVHDEVIFTAPSHEAEDVAKAIGEVMTTTFNGVPIESDPEVYGPSWGHGYGATE